ncbi:MAG: hypothetical protein HOE90_20205 [Bacteriovoracaceae bacterium]|jgi:6-pyruvoyl-tetrahydropterin synthase|nr:hypothetical protein [Bacteriovoracaceae bacterium]
MKLTLFYNGVTVLDYAYYDESLGVVGNSLYADVEFVGETDDEGVIFDFSHAKKKVKEIIDRDCDHRFVIPQGLLKKNGEVGVVDYKFGTSDQSVYYEGPLEAFCEIPTATVSYENISAYLEDVVLKELPNNISSVKISLREEIFSEDDEIFHYTHGLRDHYGNCQRLFHGHRNSINVIRNGKRSRELEQTFSEKQFTGNIHFCYWDNVENKDQILAVMDGKEPEGKHNQIESVVVTYKSGQGIFKCVLPGSMVYFLPIESTVENLGLYFAKASKSMVDIGDSITVRAFEGIGKGSIASL